MILLILLIFLAPCALAQQVVPDSSIARLAWGSVNVLVQSDTLNGILVWAETSGLTYSAKDLRFSASFNPDSVDPWLNFANAVVTAANTPSSTEVAIETPPLFARDSSAMVLLRRRKEQIWEPHTTILLLDRDRKQPWYIDVGRDDAMQLLRVLFRQAGHSRQKPDTSHIHDVNPLARFFGPVPLDDGPVPSYPFQLRRMRVSGEVWMDFVIREDGTADPNSFHVLLSDDKQFAEAAIDAVRRARYLPARIDRKPVATRVHQRFTFRIRRS
jgi:TonB family protein